MLSLCMYVARQQVLAPSSLPPSKLLHINHLTRPFTKVQLFELLTVDGPIVQELFWTNRIKSHCIALVGVVCVVEDVWGGGLGCIMCCFYYESMSIDIR